MADASAPGGPQDDEVEATLAATRALVGVVVRSLAGALEQVTLPQFRILVVLHTAGSMRSGALAEQIGVHQSTFTRTADRLVAGGWIRRETSPESRREVLVHLTPAGRGLVEQVMQRRRAEIAEVLRRALPEDRALIRRGMEAFARAGGEPSPVELLGLGF